MFGVQAEGCAPIVRAFEAGKDHAEPWADPITIASGLRVPAPLGDRLILRAIRESGGGAIAVSDTELGEAARRLTAEEGIDMCPEGGASVAGALALLERGELRLHDQIVTFNTGGGWLYRPAR
jgi:threonine synthase